MSMARSAHILRPRHLWRSLDAVRMAVSASVALTTLLRMLDHLLLVAPTLRARLVLNAASAIPSYVVVPSMSATKEAEIHRSSAASLTIIVMETPRATITTRHASLSHHENLRHVMDIAILTADRTPTHDHRCSTEVAQDWTFAKAVSHPLVHRNDISMLLTDFRIV